MAEELLAHVLRRDRLKVLVTQRELQQKVNILAIKDHPHLPEEVRAKLLSTQQNEIEIDGKFYWSGISKSFVSKIERGVSKWISNKERQYLAEALGLPLDKYIGIEIDPMNLLVPAVNLIERSIVFEPQDKQAGVSILSYFAEILNRRYAGVAVKTAIVQEGSKVTMRIETPDGTMLDEVERTLTDYGLVVMGQMPIERFTDDKELIRDLNTKLQVAALELRLTKENYLERTSQDRTRIGDLENQVGQLTTLIGISLQNIGNFGQILERIASTETLGQSLKQSLSIISKLSSAPDNARNRREMLDAFNQVRRDSPPLYQRILESVPAGIAANLLSPWVQTLITSLPK
jgi:transcriptional regulator with XRE-family HTH domain